MQDVFIISISRTPIGRFHGLLSTVPAPRLGATAIKGALQKAAVAPEAVEEVFMGNVLTANEGQAPARQAAIFAGIPERVPCTTINKVCASGMKAIMLAAQSIMLEDKNLIVAGGMENMSAVPYYLPKAREGYRLGHGKLTDGIIRDGLWDPYHDFHMGNAAEKCAAKYKLSREAQDAFAAESYRRAAAAWKKGFFKNEITPVVIEGKTPVEVEVDEEFTKVNFEKMSRLQPVFQEDGTITAANASKINDGAAALVLAGEKKVQELGLKPLARIVSFADAAQAPEWFTTTPALAMQNALKKAGLSMEEMDYAEINEAFSCVTLVNEQLSGLPHEKVNIRGGAVALGHPLGCSGARIMVTLTDILDQNQAQHGIAGICNGGGGASAMIIQRC